MSDKHVNERSAISDHPGGRILANAMINNVLRIMRAPEYGEQSDCIFKI